MFDENIPLSPALITPLLCCTILFMVLSTISFFWVQRFRKKVIDKNYSQNSMTNHQGILMQHNSLREETRQVMSNAGGIPSMENLFNVDVIVAVKQDETNLILDKSMRQRKDTNTRQIDRLPETLMDSVESEIPSMLFTPDDDIKVEKRSINNLLIFTSLLITYNGVFIICLVTSYWSD